MTIHATSPRELLNDALAEVSPQRLEMDVTEICKNVRNSGSPGEA